MEELRVKARSWFYNPQVANSRSTHQFITPLRIIVLHSFRLRHQSRWVSARKAQNIERGSSTAVQRHALVRKFAVSNRPDLSQGSPKIRSNQAAVFVVRQYEE